MIPTVTEIAPGKINLTLDVFAPRPDGYHDLDSIVMPFLPGDLVTLTRAEPSAPLLTFTCSDPSLPTDHRNLAVRAAQTVQEQFPALPPVSLTLIKRLPYQAGLGGGSSDAAATLRAFQRLFELPEPILLEMAPALGSDVPLFMAGATVRMQGRGERITALPYRLPRLQGVVIKPDIGVPTGPAYALLDALSDRIPGNSTGRFLEALKMDSPLSVLAGELHNDFEAAIFPAYPEIMQAATQLREAGALRAILCGSGSALFGLAENETHAERIASALRNLFTFVEVVSPLP